MHKAVPTENLLWERACSRLKRLDLPEATVLLNQHLPGAGHVFMDLLLDPRVNQLHRAAAIRARQGCRGAEQPTDQRPLVIHRAAIGAQVHAVQFIHRGVLLGPRLTRQARHFFWRSGYRTTAVMAAGHALERGDLLAKSADFLTVAAHRSEYRESEQGGILP